MTKSALKLIASQEEVVEPKTGKDGIKQPAYTRSKKTVATSSKLLKYRGCIATEMAGQTATGRKQSRDQFAAAAKKCSEML